MLLRAVVFAVLLVSVVVVSGRDGNIIKRTKLAAAGCNDSPPDNKYTCSEQKNWGKCTESFMKGFCQITCGMCNASAPTVFYSPTSAPASSPFSTSVVRSVSVSSLPTLGIKTSVPLSADNSPIKSYGARLQSNKQGIYKALKSLGLPDAKIKLYLAMAMLETNSMDPADRDKAKTGVSTNYSAWNLNQDMITRLYGLGLLDKQISSQALLASLNVNDLNGRMNAIKIIVAATNAWGVNDMLNYNRGGYTGWKDGVSYGCLGYRNAIAQMVQRIDSRPELLQNDQRIDIFVQNV